MNSSVFDFHCQSIDGQDVSLGQFQGNVLLIVVTASKCGFTPQFRGMEYLYRRYKDRGFTVLGFPCNQLNRQEPYDNERIADFCVRNYGVSFPMFSRVLVNGPQADPLFGFLRPRAPGIWGTERLKWTFTKFLVNRSGQPVRRYSPTTYPRLLSRTIERLLE